MVWKVWAKIFKSILCLEIRKFYFWILSLLGLYTSSNAATICWFLSRIELIQSRKINTGFHNYILLWIKLTVQPNFSSKGKSGGLRYSNLERLSNKHEANLINFTRRTADESTGSLFWWTRTFLSAMFFLRLNYQPVQ